MYFYKILKFIITLCIIYLHAVDSESKVGDYDELILTQRTPAAAHLYLQSMLKSGSMNSSAALEYLQRYWIVLDTRIWILNELRSTKSDGEALMDCVDDDGDELEYATMLPPDDFIDTLRRKWPAFCSNVPEHILWQLEYNVYGSCIKPTPLEYYEKAIELLDERNIGTILQRAGIVPGASYTLDSIINVIEEVLRTRAYVKCLPSENVLEQYLIEVQICFNKQEQLINCTNELTGHCEMYKNVVYAGSNTS